MPFRGIILILLVVIVVCVACKDQIYADVKKFFEKDIDKGEDEE